MCPSISDISAVSYAIFLDPLFLSSLCFNCILLTIQSSEFSICQTCKITLDHLLCRKARLQAYWLPCHSFINILMSQAYWKQRELMMTLIVSSETISCHRYATSCFFFCKYITKIHHHRHLYLTVVLQVNLAQLFPSGFYLHFLRWLVWSAANTGLAV